MNWALFAIGVGVASTLAVYLRGRRSAGTFAGRLLAGALLVVVCLNGAAPVRGLIDPNYVGYEFGLLRAEQGIAVTVIAGTVVLLAFFAALVAASCSAGPRLWFVAAVSGGLAIVLGLPLIADAFTRPTANVIQLGEYLTIPGLLATMLMAITMVLPLAIGAWWAGESARIRP